MVNFNHFQPSRDVDTLANICQKHVCTQVLLLALLALITLRAPLISFIANLGLPRSATCQVPLVCLSMTPIQHIPQYNMNIYNHICKRKWVTCRLLTFVFRIY